MQDTAVGINVYDQCSSWKNNSWGTRGWVKIRSVPISPYYTIVAN